MVGPGTVVDVSFSGVSTQYIVDVPGLGSWTVFAQNLGVDAVARRGDSGAARCGTPTTRSRSPATRT